MAKVTLLIPEWPSAPFWPILYPDGYHADVFVTDKEVIDKSELVIHPGKLGANIFKGIPNTNFLALRLDFEQVSNLRPKRQTIQGLRSNN